ncbi:MAG: hypothetical protein LQ338_006886 [Usnochroma carphineum]|nr:MAG: hypothetical protein LQ338_006886 [Usnochroma carphineum]
MISNVYSKTFLQSSKDAHELTRSILFDRLLPLLNQFSIGCIVDVHELNYAITMDFISSYIFGLGNDSNFIQDVEMRQKYLAWHFKRTEHSFWYQEIPRLTQIIQSMGIRLVPKWVDVANDEIQAFLLRMCERARQSMESDTGYAEKEQRTRPVVYSQLSESLKKSTTKQEGPQKEPILRNLELHVASELLDHVVAGMDTSGITLTYLFWQMSRNMEQQIALRKELLQLKYVTAAVYTNFMTNIVDDRGIEQVDAYVAGPKANQLKLRFTRLHLQEGEILTKKEFW